MLVATLLLAATVEAPVTADGLMAQVVARASETARLRHERGLTGTKREQVHDTEEKPEQLLTDKEFRVTMVPDGLLHQLTRLNGTPVSGTPLERPEIDPTVLIVSLHAKYTFRMASPEPVDGYYSVSFDPKQPVTSAANDTEMVINHLSGIIYIDEHRKFVRRFQAWLEKPFSVKGIGRVHEASALLDQEIVEDLPVPRRSVFSVRYSKAIFWDTATRTTVTYGYAPLPVIQTPLP